MQRGSWFRTIGVLCLALAVLCAAAATPLDFAAPSPLSLCLGLILIGVICRRSEEPLSIASAVRACLSPRAPPATR